MRLKLRAEPFFGPALVILVVGALSFEAVGQASTIGLSNLYPSNAFLAFSTNFFKGTLVLASGFSLLLYVLICIALVTGVVNHLRLKGHRRDEIVGPSVPVRVKRRVEYVALCLAMFASFVLVLYPRTYQTLPIGGDTLFYMSVVQTIHKEGALWAVKYTDRPLLYITLYGVQSLSGLSVGDFFKILPETLAGILTFNVWLFVRTFYKSAAIYAAVITAVSTSLMRTTIDLYASLFATCLLLLCLAVYTGGKDKNGWADRILLPALPIALLLSYWFLWVFLLVILAVTDLSLSNRKSRVRRLIRTFLPSIFVWGLFLYIAVANPPPSYWGLGTSFATYLGKSVTPVGAVTSNSVAFSIANLPLLTGESNVLLPVLACISLALLGPKSYGLKIVYIWASVTLAMTLLSSTGIHAALLFPLPLLAGLGVRKIVELT